MEQESAAKSPLDRVAAALAEDGEFRLASRHWTGTLAFEIGERTLTLALCDGRLVTGEAPAVGDLRAIRVSGPAEVWARVLAPVPPPFFNDILPARAFGLAIDGEPETFWQYYPAVQRAVQVLRDSGVR